ncbi:hypothetical protein FK531_02205 [Rhodococcus spelaei]|uniref:Uncharacterized protein n=1 Tax=Rhodococcus spelaei TaxID=2546320 RepID=A0A541BRD8_9NOCA|nr:hypothetical protein [Rhodococcus spelaei]TQF74900.1 hypothetical protein FK531_02205 [Rhodococcus spelaei]
MFTTKKIGISAALIAAGTATAAVALIAAPIASADVAVSGTVKGAGVGKANCATQLDFDPLSGYITITNQTNVVSTAGLSAANTFQLPAGGPAAVTKAGKVVKVTTGPNPPVGFGIGSITGSYTVVGGGTCTVNAPLVIEP